MLYQSPIERLRRNIVGDLYPVSKSASVKVEDERFGQDQASMAGIDVYYTSVGSESALVVAAGPTLGALSSPRAVALMPCRDTC